MDIVCFGAQHFTLDAGSTYNFLQLTWIDSSRFNANTSNVLYAPAPPLLLRHLYCLRWPWRWRRHRRRRSLIAHSWHSFTSNRIKLFSFTQTELKESVYPPLLTPITVLTPTHICKHVCMRFASETSPLPLLVSAQHLRWPSPIFGVLCRRALRNTYVHTYLVVPYSRSHAYQRPSCFKTQFENVIAEVGKAKLGLSKWLFSASSTYWYRVYIPSGYDSLALRPSLTANGGDCLQRCTTRRPLHNVPFNSLFFNN